ncbi:MAG TPA: DPP IV N-terminal domain-containing protein [Candidatus Limnocylindrales bacterium]|nr:DPP IV N-terminal domain-containing protein [Candidatus Limnocylindrales bacterium]
MKLRNHRTCAVERGLRLPFGCMALLVGLFLLGASLYGHTQSGAAAPPPGASQEREAAPPVRANYELASRFMPDRISKLVFDTSVTPHWFETSDRFWYRYETTDGARYWVVDPLKRVKTPLWDNAKIAASLSTLTNFPYDAQHLPVKHLRLLDHDTKMRFDVEIRKDAVVPNEPKREKSQEDISEANQTNQNQAEQTDAQNQKKEDEENADDEKAGEKPHNTRTIYFEYDLATASLKRLDNFDAPPKRPKWASISPDAKTVIFARGQNLYMMDGDNYAKAAKKAGDTSVVETQLTTDGIDRFSYARTILPEQEEVVKKEDKGDTNKAGIRVPPVMIHWSQDSKKFALIRDDDRKVADYWVIHSLANPRPTLETYKYELPGEDNVTIQQIEIFDVASKQRLIVPTRNFSGQYLQIENAPMRERDREDVREQQEDQEGPSMLVQPMNRWLAETSDKLYFTAGSRDFRRIDVCVADTSTGTPKTLIEERSNVWMDTRPLRSIANGAELIWWSERDGWGHYYLYGGDGKLKNQITSGEYMADEIISIDEKARVMYFTANGREAGEDPYYTHLYRTGLDGTGLKLLTPGNFSHAPSAPDSGRSFVDTYSRVDTAPKSVLLDDQGTQLSDLETTDVRQLLAAGFQYPETFHVKADDGITDLYGVMYKPFDFNANRKYPLIEYVYPGPQTESVNKTFTPKSPNIPLAQLGFIVIEVGNRGGSPQRDKWYDSYGYGNLRDYGLADKKDAAEELAAMHPYIDLTRVGIWGHSGGGFMSTAALLQYPGFFKAAWSESGNHDNNVYNHFWSEKYHGVREETEKNGTEKFIYAIDKNSEIAKNLRGHLMLTTGDMDNNVSMVNTMRVANALIKANKRFEMLVFPGMRHSYMPINTYVIARRGDFFAHWLLGSDETDADIIELQREKQATPSKKFSE